MRTIYAGSRAADRNVDLKAFHVPTTPGKSEARRRGGLAALVAALAIALVSVTSGCVAVIAGAGTGAVVGFSLGKLDAELAKPIDRTEKATHDAIVQLQFAPISENFDAFNAEYISRTSSDTKVKIELTKKDDQITKVQIRVGVFGDEAESVAILEKIKANLGN